MIIVVTGMVGVDKKSYLQKVCRYADERGQEVVLCNVGDMMYAESPDVPQGKILDISLKRLHLLRRSVFKDIIAKAHKVPNMIVNTHATFRWRHGLFPAVDFDQMRQLAADMYICLIDGVSALHTRLSKEHETDHSLKDLIVWREEEIISTEMLCKGINEKIPFYCLARGAEEETTDTFYQLAFERKIKKAYLSFPMTDTANLETLLEKIDQFRQTMRELFLCFDPADLVEADLPQKAKKAKREGLGYVEVFVPALRETIKLDLNEVCQIERDINCQTYARDFMLIDQSDMIISFIPTMTDGRAAISSGVERELQHAHEAAKEVYVIWAAKQTPSVFVTQTATKVFPDITNAIDFFKEKYPDR
jgi:adenylate kinase